MNTSRHIQQVFETYGVIISDDTANSIFTHCSQSLKRLIHFSCTVKNKDQYPAVWKGIAQTLTGMKPPAATSSMEYNAAFFDCFSTAMNNVQPSGNWMLKPSKASQGAVMHY